MKFECCRILSSLVICIFWYKKFAQWIPHSEFGGIFSRLYNKGNIYTDIFQLHCSKQKLFYSDMSHTNPYVRHKVNQREGNYWGKRSVGRVWSKHISKYWDIFLINRHVWYKSTNENYMRYGSWTGRVMDHISCLP